MARQRDLGWQYCSRISETDRSFVKCNFCQREIHGGISRFKQHIAKLKGECKGCTRVPAAVSREMREYIAGKKLERQQRQEASEKAAGVDNGNLEVVLKDEADEGPLDVVRPTNEDELVPRMDRGKGITGDDSVSALASMRSRQSAGRLSAGGSMDIEPYVHKVSNKRMKVCVVRDARKVVCKAIAKFFYHAAIPFNAANSPYFQPMFDTIAQYGAGIKQPSALEIGGPLLEEEVNTISDHTTELKSSWKATGCSIMADGWTDVNGRTLINFLAYCPKGTVFVRSVDASELINDSQLLFGLLDDVVEEVGERNVIQVVTENTTNFMLAGTALMEKRKNLFWTPCAAHCIETIFLDMSRLKSVSDALKRSKKLTRFIYNHALLLNLMRKFTNGRELIRPAVTRFGTAYMTLESLNAARAALIQMFSSDEWRELIFSKTKEGRQVEKIVGDAKFWSKVEYAVQCTAPLIKVLKLVEADDKPTMGYIYDAVERAKLAIRDGNGSRFYQAVWRIIDARWETLLHHPLHAAGYYLNPAIHYSQDFARNPEIIRGLQACIQRLQPDPDAQLEAMNQSVSKYAKALGDFGSDLAIRSRKKMDPAIWWETYSMDCPELRDVAIKILSQTCSSSSCERIRSTFDLIQSKRRCRLTGTKLNKLVYVHYNLRLRARQNDRDVKLYNPINLDYMFHEDPTEEWLVEGKIFPHEQQPLLDIPMDMNNEEGEFICSGGEEEEDEDDDMTPEDVQTKEDAFAVGRSAGDLDEDFLRPPYDFELGDANSLRQPAWP